MNTETNHEALHIIAANRLAVFFDEFLDRDQFFQPPTAKPSRYIYVTESRREKNLRRVESTLRNSQ